MFSSFLRCLARRKWAKSSLNTHIQDTLTEEDETLSQQPVYSPTAQTYQSLTTRNILKMSIIGMANVTFLMQLIPDGKIRQGKVTNIPKFNVVACVRFIRLFHLDELKVVSHVLNELSRPRQLTHQRCKLVVSSAIIVEFCKKHQHTNDSLMTPSCQNQTKAHLQTSSDCFQRMSIAHKTGSTASQRKHGTTATSLVIQYSPLWV